MRSASTSLRSWVSCGCADRHLLGHAAPRTWAPVNQIEPSAHTAGVGWVVFDAIPAAWPLLSCLRGGLRPMSGADRRRILAIATGAVVGAGSG